MAKRRPRKKPMPVRIGEVPTAEFCRQVGGIIKEVLDRDVHDRIIVVRGRILTECMLDAYLLRGFIEPCEHKAGMKYRLAWQRARDGLKVRDRFSSGRTYLNYSDSMCVIEFSERILKEAHRKLSSAQKTMVIKVCGEDKRAGGSYKIDTLKVGLAQLAKFWGYA